LLHRGQRTLAVAWVLAVAGNALLNTLLKEIFERARPIHGHGVLIADGWSFPSGHSSGSVVAYGMLAYLLNRLVSADWRLPILLSAVAVAFTTGFSRVFLQVHYVSDVLAGFASGLLWLTICVGSTEWHRWRPSHAESGATAER
jgi:membrane-associated phospholipid phosphatase